MTLSQEGAFEEAQVAIVQLWTVVVRTSDGAEAAAAALQALCRQTSPGCHVTSGNREDNQPTAGRAMAEEAEEEPLAVAVAVALTLTSTPNSIILTPNFNPSRLP